MVYDRCDNIPVGHSHVVEETLRGRRTVGKETSVFAFTCLAQSVGAGVPEYLTSLGVAERHKKDIAVLLQRPVQVPQLSINLGNNNIGTQILGHIAQERSRSGFEGFGGDRGGGVAVANVKSDVDLWVRAIFGLFEVLLPEFLEELVSLNHNFGEDIGARGLLGLRIRIFWRGSGGFRGFLGLRFSGRPHGEILGGFRCHV